MLRLGLVEELRRLVDGVVVRAAQPRAGAEVGSRPRRRAAHSRDDDLDRLLRAEVEANGRLSAAFVVELLQWLRDQPSSAAPAWQALQRALEAQGDSPEELLRVEHQREATDQLAIGNVITSMRLLSSIDWPLFFDRVSVVEQILKEDPAGAYAEMDFRDPRSLPALGRAAVAAVEDARARVARARDRARPSTRRSTIR